MQPDDAVPRSLGSTPGPLCTDHDLVLLDLDGVVYAGPDALPGVPGHLAACRAAGSRLGFITNNAARPPATVAEHLRHLGVESADGDVVTAAQAAARLVAGLVPPGAPVLVVGGEGLVAALDEHGLPAVWSARDEPAAVVQGFHPTVGWPLLAEGAYALATGVPWVASNLDRTVPTDRGRAPGNGTLVDVLRATSGREPLVAGKPEPALFDEARRLLGGSRPLVVGDRIDTDIVGATRAGLPSLLVLTGVSSLADACAAVGDERPSYVAADARSLLLAHPAVESADEGVRCGDWLADADDGVVRLQGPQPGSGEDAAAAAALAALRAVVAACWQHRDARGSADRNDTDDMLDISAAERQLRDMMA